MISVIVLVVDFCQRSGGRLYLTTIRRLGQADHHHHPLPTTHSRRPDPEPPPRRASSTCRIVTAERRRTMVNKSRRQQRSCTGQAAEPPVDSGSARTTAKSAK